MANEAQLVQRLLNEAGFDAGTVDGRFGPQTRAALERFRENVGSAEPAQVAAIQQALQAVADAGIMGRRDNIEAVTSSIEAAAAVATPAQVAETPAAEAGVDAAPATAPEAAAAETPAAEATALPADAGLPDLSPEAAAEIAAQPTHPTYTVAARGAGGEYDTLDHISQQWLAANPEATAPGGQFEGLEGHRATVAVRNQIMELNNLELRNTCRVNGVMQQAPYHEGTRRAMQPGDELRLPEGRGIGEVPQVFEECEVCEPAPTPTPTPRGVTPQPQPQPQPQPDICTSLPAGSHHVAIDTDRDGRTDTARNVSYNSFMRLVRTREAYPGEVGGVGTSLPYGYCAPIGRDGGDRPDPAPTPAPDCPGCGPTGPGDDGVETGFLNIPGLPHVPAGVTGGQEAPVGLADAGRQATPAGPLPAAERGVV